MSNTVSTSSNSSSNELPEDKWRFTIATTKKGLIYVISYQNYWDPVKQQSRTKAKRQVGRLFPDGRVAISPRYLVEHPEYSEGEWFYEKNNLVTRSAGERKEALQKSSYEYRLESIQVGLTTGLWQLAKSESILDNLITVFGKETALELLRLAIYQLDSGEAMMNYEDWLCSVHLPHAHPIDGRRISEILSEVSQSKIDQYFRLRHARAKETTDALRKRLKSENPNAYLPPFSVAFDSTSINTYSQTIIDAAYGHAKEDKTLEQVNLTFLTDYNTGEVVYAYESNGSINDKNIFSKIIARLIAAKFDIADMLTVTDRGYCSMFNIQTEINTELKFLCGVPIIEDALKKSIDKHRKSLLSPAFYSGQYHCSAYTYKELWTQQLDHGQVTVNVHVHLYYDAKRAAQDQDELLSCVDKLLEDKNNGKSVDGDEWLRAKRFIIENTSGHGKRWIRNASAIDSSLKYAGYFVLRSNEVADAFEALKLYRQRNIVEQNFRRYKSDINGRRLRATDSSYLGKIFIHTLAQGLNMMLFMNAVKNAPNNSSFKQLPNQSLRKALLMLKNIHAERPLGRNLWMTRPISKKQRDLLTLLGLPIPPNLIRD